jgi:hypothetical protein
VSGEQSARLGGSNRGSRGAFIAWVVDFACFALEARERADEEHQREMHLWDRKLYE